MSKIVGKLSSVDEIDSAVLFGSRALGTFQNGSDIDLAVSAVKIDDCALLNLASELEDLNLPYQFDLVHLESVKSSDLLSHIKSCVVCIFSRSKEA